MKLLKYVSALVLGLLAQTALADDIDYGEMELGKTYHIDAGGSCTGTFTPTQTGTLTITSDTYECPTLEDQNTNIVSWSPKILEYQVTAGTTYTVISPVLVSKAMNFVLTMPDPDAPQSITLQGIEPTDGSAISLGGSYPGQVSISFDQNPYWSKVTVEAGKVTRTVTANTSVGHSMFFETKEVLLDAIAQGMQAGDPITITITGLCLATNKSVLYGEDGTLVIHYTLESVPTMLVSSTVDTSKPFLSYYLQSNPAGQIQFTFSRPISHAEAALNYGNIDKDGDGEYYYENLADSGKVSVQGCVVTVDVSNRLRTHDLMLPVSITDYNEITLRLLGVKDENGDYTVSSEQGAIGSYGYLFSFEEVKANIVADFDPASGSSLSGHRAVEIYIVDDEKLNYDGIEFTYDKDGTRVSQVVTDYTKEVDTDEPTARILTVAIPAEAQSAKNVTVSLHNLECADGKDYSDILSAYYNTTADAIQGVANASQKVAMYNLQGQQMQQAQGIVIRSGKKFISK